MHNELYQKHMHVSTYVTHNQAVGHAKTTLIFAIKLLQTIPGQEERVREMQDEVEKLNGQKRF